MNDKDKAELWRVAMKEVLGELNYPINANSELLKKLKESYGELAKVVEAKSGQLANLNIKDKSCWPILVVGNTTSKSLTYLKLFARTYLSGYKAFSVVCNKRPEWDGFIRPQTNDFLAAFYEDAAQEQLVTIAANSHNRAGWSTLLVLEDLKKVTTVDFESRQKLAYFQTKGPPKGVFAIAGAAYGDLPHLLPWIERFNTIVAVE